MIFFMLIFSGKKPRLDRTDILPMAGIGIVGVTLYFLFENNGIKHLSASEASIVVGTIPVITVTIDSIIQKARISFMLVSGAILSTIGVTIMVIESLRFSGSVAGYLFMGGAALAWVVYSFTAPKLEKKYSALETTFWHSLFGAIGFIPFLSSEHPLWPNVSTSICLNVLFLAVFGSALGYYFYIESLSLLGASITNIFINLIPVISVLGAFVFLKEKITLIQYIGGTLAIFGVFIVNRFSAVKTSDSAIQAENF